MTNRSDHARIIVIHATLPTTIAVGVYNTVEDAKLGYISFLKDNYPNLLGTTLTKINNTTGVHVGNINTKSSILASSLFDNNEVEDMFSDEISHAIISLVEDERFDFRGWSDWDLDSLYHLQLTLDTGKRFIH